MPLLGSAAMLLSFDVAADAVHEWLGSDVLKRAGDQITGAAGLVQRGATNISSVVYAMHYSLSCTEISKRAP